MSYFMDEQCECVNPSPLCNTDITANMKIEYGVKTRIFITNNGSSSNKPKLRGVSVHHGESIA